MLEKNEKVKMKKGSKDITPALMQDYFEAERLGELSVQIPKCGVISADLDSLYRHATGLEFFEYQIGPKDIEAMVVYGSVLYKHFPREITTNTRKKWLFFGPEIKEELIQPRKMPSDFDVMIITGEGLTDDKIIVPERSSVDKGYGYFESISSTAVETKRMARRDYGYIEIRGGANLHITYRSVEQLIRGSGQGDTVSESVIRYGVPIIGRDRFSEIIQDVPWPEREELHHVEWREDLEGKLQGII